MRSCSWEILERGDELVVKLAGSIDEGTDLSDLFSLQGNKIAIDLEQVERITSSGVRHWVHFITTICKKHQVVLERCSSPFVQLGNVLSNLTNRAKIVSVMLPYFCDVCESEKCLVVDITPTRPTIEESIPCPTCDGSMVFDDFTNAYLDFAYCR
jgi:anti-anti-sigma regulatory factor